MENFTMLISMPGGSEWILIVLVVLIFFGGKKIPELMRGVGRGVREFKDAKGNLTSELEKGMNEKPLTQPATANASGTTVDSVA